MKGMSSEACLRFVPSRITGLPGVTEVVVRSDRQELFSNGSWVTFKLTEIAQGPWPARVWRLLSRVGRHPAWLPVADRDWFHPPADRYFTFYTNPPVTVYMPVDDPTDWQASTFWRLQTVLWSGGFHTSDLG